ncbi:MAG: trigger factor [Eubacteriales bacterium]|nr:trigger factor [Eubacteriales bacterium]
MSLQVEKLEKNMAKLTIVVPASEFEKALQSAYNKQKKNINVPGFRKGKVPRAYIEKLYGAEIFYEEAANQVMPAAYENELKDSDLPIVSRPEINVEQIEKGKDFIFTAMVALKPEVTLGEYKGMEVDKVSTRVTQKEVEAKIQEEAEKNARSVAVEGRPVAENDEVVLDFEGFVDGVPFEGGKGENYPLTIGSGAFIPGFEEQLIGVNAEEEVEIQVKFPENYHSEDLKGKDATFKCTVHEIKVKEIPEIDDEFAAEVSEFDTLDEYKADVKAQIKAQKEAEGNRKKEDQAVEKAVANATMEIPEAMIETQTEDMVREFAQNIQYQGFTLEQYFQITGQTEETMKAEMRPQAQKRIETRLVLEAIAKAENIEISDEKVDEELAKMAESYQMEVEKLKGFMGEAEMKQMKEDMAVQEAVTLLVETAVEK